MHMENLVLSLIISLSIHIPLALKWELELKYVAPAGVINGFLAGVVLNLLSIFFTIGFTAKLIIATFLVIVFSGVLLLIRFYRDPERVPPCHENIIVSPADGIIKYIKRVGADMQTCSSKGNESVVLASPFTDILTYRGGHLIGIGMSFLDVHVTRAPMNGRVAYSEHVSGSFLSLKRPDAVYRNERLNQIFENDCYAIGLIHIASRLVRAIVCYANEGEWMSIGQKIGMIKFGSQVDVLLPDAEGLRLDVRVGQKLLAGETIIAKFKRDKEVGTM
jgi:phosphatidylserine decarboxylase